MRIAGFLLLIICLRAGGFCAAQTTSGNGAIKLPVIEKQDIRFIRVSTDGEPLNRSTSGLTQDGRGFIWFATSAGVYRYDGYTLTPYVHEPNNPNSISDDNVRTVFRDRTGDIWISSVAGGVDRFDLARGVFTHFRHQPGVEQSLSNDNVASIYQDRSGMLWFATNGGADRLDPATGKFRHYLHNPQDSSSLSSPAVTKIYEDRHHNLWVGTTRGLNKLDRTTGRSSHFFHDPSNPNSLGDDFVSSICEDRYGVLWIGSVFGDGLSALDPNTGEFKRYSFHSEESNPADLSGLSAIHEDADGGLWLGTVQDGLIRLDPSRKEFARYTQNPANPNSLHDNSVDAIYEDAEGVMWLGTKTGVSRFVTRSLAFTNYRHEANQPQSLPDNLIWSVQPDSQGFLWIGTGQGVERLDRKSGSVRIYRHDARDRYSVSNNVVSAIREDKSGILWFGTWGGGLDSFDRATGRFMAFRNNPNKPGSLGSDRVQCLWVDHEGALWVGTHNGGLSRYDPSTRLFKTYRHDPADPHSLSDDNIRALFEDHTGTLWVGTVSGGLDRLDRKSDGFVSYRHNSADAGSLSSDAVASIHEDRRGVLWVGTRDGLNRMDESSGRFTKFTTSDGLPDHDIEAILEDRHGELWLATHYGLSHFLTQSGKFQNYSDSDGLAGNNLTLYGMEAACRLPNGEMAFGSTDGLTVFDPERLSGTSYVPPVVLTNFLLFNRPVSFPGNSPLKQPIWATSAVTLNHKQSIFTLEFAALSYVAPERNRYRYRMEGLENEWNQVEGKRPEVIYSNLPPGKYVFRAQGSNNNLQWNEKGIQLAITVLPPWWRTWWFTAILVFCASSMIIAAHLVRVRGLQLAAARLEREVAERTRELELAKRSAEIAKDAAEKANRAKSAFLSLMSHELRTPLNAILGFAGLLRDGEISEKQQADLDRISRSGEHLLALINQVLDIAKIEAGHKTVEIAPCDLTRLINDVMDIIRERASAKHLAVHLIQPPEFPRFVQTDGRKLRQVLINLLANAVKFTGEGSVSLRLGAERGLAAEEWLLTFEVEDTGIGISPEDQERIFEAFVQVGKTEREKGTGLGLSISRQFVELLGGSIRVGSVPGQGSRFQVTLPVLQSHQAEASIPVSESEYVLEAGQPEYRILIVDDDADNRELLQRILTKARFHVKACANGAEAVEAFRSWRPHFIWTDLRMPGMDGVEVMRRIRAIEGGRDVKIAALSASTDASGGAHVLTAGMDDFVRKPFRANEIFECLARYLGVKYCRSGDGPTPGPAVAALRSEALQALPGELRAELTNAIVTLDITRVMAVIARVSERDAALGSALAFYAERSALTKIYNVLNGAADR
jgi:signal transduction histidine kinase/ligand-binding sensor domain-containing protein/CheY-like chemotaxis protein